MNRFLRWPVIINMVLYCNGTVVIIHRLTMDYP